MKCFFCLLLFAASVVFLRAQSPRQPDFTISGEAARPVAAIAYSSDSQLLAVAGSDNAVLLYSVRTNGGLKAGLSRRLTRHQAPILALAFNDSNTLVSVSLDQTAKFWNVASGKLLHSTKVDIGKHILTALAPGNEPFLAGATSNRVRLWNYQSGKLLKSFDANDSNVSTLAFTPDGKLLVVGTIKGVIRVMDVAAWRVSRIIDMDSPIHSLAARSNQIAVGYADGTLDLLRLGEQTSVPETKAHDRAVSAVAFSPNGERMVSGSVDGAVKVWDGDSLRLLYTLAGQTTQVLSIVFSPDGKQVATVNADGEVDGWGIR